MRNRNIMIRRFLYGSKTWTLKRYERYKLEAFEMWACRNMDIISWKDDKTNEYVLDQIKKIEAFKYYIRIIKFNY